ncbi:hypothetical protein SAMN04488577_2072 [Bacillus sp. cl95]|nr:MULTISPECIES: hypothetical protein [unclassified Bacillus (in: firmicutes)]SFA99451.1 hypothetical protein SAMN02799634_103442 [Bacillus sp. UNCCL13]SFQ81640.1 hypothetical protein SAMN04488577_2072 [Bacillus sp. cl95]
MYRFSIEGEDWILRFSPNIVLEGNEKKAILTSLLQIGKDLDSFSHGHSFLIFNKNIGAIVFSVERIPSLILTITNIVPKSDWYIQDPSLDQKLNE